MCGARVLAAVGLLALCFATSTAARALPAVGGGWYDAPSADDEAQTCACNRAPLSEVSSLPTDAPLIVTGVTDKWPATRWWAKRELTRGRKGDLRGGWPHRLRLCATGSAFHSRGSRTR